MNEFDFLKIFRPIYARRLERADFSRMHFAYYTSATTGLNILRGRSLWMRSAACMNDYREIDYGIQLINTAVQGSARRQAQMKRIATALGWGENMIGSILADLNRNERKFTTHTYLACVSEHDFEADAKGRLSMWRAYGRKTGVAFILNPATVIASTKELALRIAPVEYLTGEQFTRGFDRMMNNVEDHIDDLKAGEPATMLEAFINMMLTSIFSIKNPGFVEEREWRFIYQDAMVDKLAYDLVSVDGIPQVIYKLPWRAVGEQGTGLPIGETLEQIIIGPSQYADVIEVAFTRCLRELGVKDAAERVVKSNIPLR
ncbi:DUF2971 domain-containing protein [uncultured Selenomonas sp.]|uniref:DUF2971 domain-containing protein n=1 Tax=uncultured Selenomonas sp. TaxID=159275 RepID=UPI0025D9A697|nr:DUF2971 domain-containing protein [uncultured Selenomonas sp.]